MIVLDTNVVSALMRRDPDPGVVAWLDELPAESVWTTAVTIFEIRFGLALMVPSRRRRQLEEAFTRSLEEDLDQRILPFDESAASAAGAMAAMRRRAGRSVEIRDALIAGIVSARKATLATGNRRHFDAFEIRIVDPWSS
ncbi:MAG: type II toxin-antitoxin system VapC family toxin [Acidobacteria bacterium]|nr:type II toxin-antitoxin system VapC family toxin [Acidobacteriota bacterium]